jgi:hypothetical protein
MKGDRDAPVIRVRDGHGRSWRIGTDADVAWIALGTSPGRTISAAIPPVFGSYATLVWPDAWEDQERAISGLMALLAGRSAGQRWWLGYLSPPDVLTGAPTVTLYAGQVYVLVEAGPDQAGRWRRARSRPSWWQDVLPDLMFPADHSWLAATLCDDDWTCVGGPVGLVDALLAQPGLQVLQVQPGEEATPPGHTAY